MIQSKAKVTNKTGLHARPASLLVNKANEFESNITIEYDGREANGKSILGVMSLGAGQGSEIIIKAEGPDEEDAGKALSDFINSGLGEN